MWIKCRCPQREDIVLKYMEADGKFCVFSSFENITLFLTLYLSLFSEIVILANEGVCGLL